MDTPIQRKEILSTEAYSQCIRGLQKSFFLYEISGKPLETTQTTEPPLQKSNTVGDYLVSLGKRLERLSPVADLASASKNALI